MRKSLIAKILQCMYTVNNVYKNIAVLALTEFDIRERFIRWLMPQGTPLPVISKKIDHLVISFITEADKGADMLFTHSDEPDI